MSALLGAKTPDGKLVAAALCLTVAADVFLLVLNRSYMDRVVGVALFIPVQLLYACRLYLQREKQATFFILERLVGLVAAVVWLALGLDLLTALVIIYFTNLTANVTEGLGTRIDIPLDVLLQSRHIRFSWGLFLFACCDVCVGLWNLGFFPGFTRVGMWFFYLPSQVLIVLSQCLEGGCDERV